MVFWNFPSVALSYWIANFYWITPHISLYWPIHIYIEKGASSVKRRAFRRKSRCKNFKPVIWPEKSEEKRTAQFVFRPSACIRRSRSPLTLTVNLNFGFCDAAGVGLADDPLSHADVMKRREGDRSERSDEFTIRETNRYI